MPRPRIYESAAERQAAYRDRVRDRELDEARIRQEARLQVPLALARLRAGIDDAARMGDTDAKVLRTLADHEILAALTRRFEDRAEELRQVRAAARPKRKVQS